jgi:hypothetical protein
MEPSMSLVSAIPWKEVYAYGPKVKKMRVPLTSWEKLSNNDWQYQKEMNSYTSFSGTFIKNYYYRDINLCCAEKQAYFT